ncbi:MAG: FCD domain-containing protein [Eubacteriales bacterium]
MAYQNNATKIVYDFICEKIRSKEWKPNDRIWTEQKLSQDLGISRVAVRQAIDKLVTLSVVRKVQGSGTYVLDTNLIALLTVPTYTLTDSDLYNIIRFRIQFDSSNVVYFLESATAEDIADLDRCYQKMLESINDPEKFFLYDFEFHRIIAEGTKNPFILKINNFVADYLIKHQQYLYQFLGPHIALEYHPLILKYIKEGDAQLASLFMRRHLEITAEEIKKRITAKTSNTIQNDLLWTDPNP